MSKTGKLIYIDIGHNVKGDSGASGGLNENQCAAQIGAALQDILLEWGYDVRLAFTADSYVYVNSIEDTRKALNESLRLRCKEANDNEADYYISIHLNSNPANTPDNKKGSGTQIYVKTNQERTLANSILGHLCNQHYDLGPSLFADGSELKGKPYKNGGVKDGTHLYVLRNTNCTAILVECCFVDNPNDIGLYNDKKPYVNHEKALLEEGVEYVNGNVFSFNFFSYGVARGLHDYINAYGGKPVQTTDVDIEGMDIHSLNYVCYTDTSDDTSLDTIIHSNSYRDKLVGGRLLSILSHQKLSGGNASTVCFLPYKNFNSVESNYATIVHYDIVKEEASLKNLANLGQETTIDGRKAIIFRVNKECNVYRSDGSSYCTLNPGTYIGMYLNRQVIGPAYNENYKYETYDSARGPVRCEPTKPSWILINFIIKPGREPDNLYNSYTGDDYAWVETNLGSAYDMQDFVFDIYI